MANNFPTIKPSLNLQFANTGILPPDVTFTRASSSGGYYDGKTVVKAEENLLPNSNSFSDTTFWNKINIGVVDLTADFKGGTEAFTITANDTSNTHALERNSPTNTFALVSGIVFTISVFAKKGTNDFLQIAQLGETNAFANFDLDTGVVGLATNTLATSMTPLGSDWYRCAITFTATNSSAVGGASFGIVPSSTSVRRESWLATGTESIDLAFAQAEIRSAATAYTPTTTQPITRFQPKLEYAIANEPVFDHNPVTGEALGLSIFEARTNLLLRSEEFDNAFWTKENATVSANQIIAPDGTLTADKFIESADAGVHLILRSGISTKGTCSIHAKAGERSLLQIRRDAGTGVDSWAWFDLIEGTVAHATGGAASIQKLGNGVYRCIFTPTSADGTVVFGLSSGALTRTASYTGDGVSGIFIWGAQLEAGAFATPYIPTVASTVTRSADAAVMTGANFSRWYRADEGSFVVEAALGSASAALLSANDNTTSNLIDIRQQTGNRMLVNAGGVSQMAQTSGSFAGAGVFSKYAAAYKVDDFTISADGAAVGTDTSGILPVVNQLFIGRTAGGTTLHVNGYIKSLQFYPKALPASLQAVTA